MNPRTLQDPVEMPAGSTLRIDDGAGVTLCVRSGEVWLTEEGGRVDHFLGAGQAFHVERDGATLVHAFRASVVGVSAAAPAKPARSFGQALLGFFARHFARPFPRNSASRP